jgi:acyl dehydratase
MTPQYWEDVVIGTRRALGTYTFTEEEIIRFGKKYDPQIFHIDPKRRNTPYSAG